MTAKLSDIYKTQYFYLTYVKDLRYLIDCCRNGAPEGTHAGSDVMEEIFNAVRRGEQITLDIADCKITSDIAEAFLYVQDQGIDVIDSTNPARNSVLTENKRNRQNKDIPTVPLPIFDGTVAPVHLANTLNTEDVYDLTFIPGQPAQVWFATICVMGRPQLKYRISNGTDELFRYVGEYVSSEMIADADEFYFSTPLGIQVLKKDENGMVLTQTHGVVPALEACSYGALVPTCFGKEQLFKHPDWVDLYKDTKGRLAVFSAQRPKSLMEVLKK